jgi:GH35 family endo-1,4-beta-xylanase
MPASRVLLFILTALVLVPASFAQPISGNGLALKTPGTNVSGDYRLDRNGYVGTYITLANEGDVTVGVNALGAAASGVAPRMNVVIADTSVGWNVAPTLTNYSHTFHLPAGTYLVRTEFNNDVEESARSLTVRDLTVTGAGVTNTSNNTNALAAASTYINRFRKGDVSVGLSGVAPGTPVAVSLKRHAFNFGTAVPGFGATDVNNYLGSNGTARQTNYQSRLTDNFNAVVPENAGKWAYNESARDGITMGHIDQILNFAQSHDMRARMHNLIWGDNGNNGQQPSWVLNSSSSGLLDQAWSGNTTSKNALWGDPNNEISERIDYYVGTGTTNDRAHKYYELDVYNESYHTGADPNIPDGMSAGEADYRRNYWNVYGASGIAAIHNEIKQTLAASGASTKVFVNEYGVLTNSDYGDYYIRHINELRQAGIVAGYGSVVDGIGAQYYPGSATSHNPRRVMETLQNLSVQGLPITLTEFGVHDDDPSITPTVAANMLEDMARLTFGNAGVNGVFMWGFHQESGSGATTLFAPAAALYTVSTANFNSWTPTEAGTRWQDLFSIDADANLDDDWDTQFPGVVVDANGTINFNGFWGDYEFTIGGQVIDLALVKGTNQYSLVIAPGDYNGDHVVDTADYIVWRDSLESDTDLRADGNGNGMIDDGDFTVWRSHFGATYSTGASATNAGVPEPATVVLCLLSAFGLVRRRRK